MYSFKIAASKILEAARISSSRPGSVPSEKAHLATLNELDGSKLSLAKAISDTESMLGGKEAELAALKDEARRLETYDPASEHEKELDGSTYVSVPFTLIILTNNNCSILKGSIGNFQRHRV